MPRRRPISEEELELFRREVADVQPLVNDTIPPTPPERPQRPRFTARATLEHPALFSTQAGTAQVHGGEALYYAVPGVQERVMRRLRRGQYPPDALLDLHGLSVEEARSEMLEFLAECRQRGVHAVLIIHGKGYSSQQGQPVLKGMVNHWLRDYPDTLAFCSALPEHGGTGALYLLLRRGESHRSGRRRH